jgi:hypothetical protein
MKNIKLFLILIILSVKISTACIAQTLTAKFKDKPITNNGICESTEKIKLEITPAPSSESKFSWTGPSGFTSTSQNPEIEAGVSATGTYTVTITITSTTGVNPVTPTTATVAIKVNPKPSGVKTDFDISGKVVTLFAIGGQTNYAYTWTSPAGKSSTSKVFENLNTPINELGTYKLAIKDTSSKCITEIERDITKSKDEKPKTPIFGTPQNDDEDNEKVYNYIFSDRDCALSECDLKGKIIEDEIIPSYPNCKFTLIDEIDDYVIIKCWSYKKDSLLYKIYNKKDGEYGEVQKYFRLSKNDFLNKARKFRNTIIPSLWGVSGKSIDFTAGVLFLPIKLRHSPEFEFSKDVSLGSFIGAKTRISHYKPNFVSLGVSVGISALTLNSTNSTLLPDKPQDVAAFTYSWGAVFEFSKVQIGLLWGKDNISDYSKNGWHFQNQTWFSVGFGYSILSRPSKDDNKAGTNNAN